MSLVNERLYLIFLEFIRKIINYDRWKSPQRQITCLFIKIVKESIDSIIFELIQQILLDEQSIRGNIHESIKHTRKSRLHVCPSTSHFEPNFRPFPADLYSEHNC